MAWRQNLGGSEQHLTRAAAAARTRTQRPGKHLAVRASELVVKPDFQILRRYRRPLLLRLEHTHRPTLEDYVHRATRLGSSRSLNMRIGISGPARPGQIKWSGPAASIGWNASRPGVSERPLGGGRAKNENSSRRHPWKCGLKRFLAVRRSWRGKWGGVFLGYLLGKNFRRRDRDHRVPPRRMDAAVCR